MPALLSDQQQAVDCSWLHTDGCLHSKGLKSLKHKIKESNPLFETLTLEAVACRTALRAVENRTVRDNQDGSIGGWVGGWATNEYSHGIGMKRW